VDRQLDRRLRELIAAHHAGDRYAADTVLRLLDEPVWWVCSEFFYPGADHDDIHQEGLYGVFKGIGSFRADRHRFDARAFLLFCAKRHIISGLKAQTRIKQQSLNEAVTLEHRHADGTGDERVTLHEVIGTDNDPVVVLEARERVRAVIRTVREDLSGLEREALRQAVNGEPYSREATGSKDRRQRCSARETQTTGGRVTWKAEIKRWDEDEAEVRVDVDFL
jgi:DNA-directed RNA polymerase specialized sigma24 family protein